MTNIKNLPEPITLTTEGLTERYYPWPFFEVQGAEIRAHGIDPYHWQAMLHDRLPADHPLTPIVQTIPAELLSLVRTLPGCTYEALQLARANRAAMMKILRTCPLLAVHLGIYWREHPMDLLTLISHLNDDFPSLARWLRLVRSDCEDYGAPFLVRMLKRVEIEGVTYEDLNIFYRSLSHMHVCRTLAQHKGPISPGVIRCLELRPEILSPAVLRVAAASALPVHELARRYGELTLMLGRRLLEWPSAIELRVGIQRLESALIYKNKGWCFGPPPPPQYRRVETDEQLRKLALLLEDGGVFGYRNLCGTGACVIYWRDDVPLGFVAERINGKYLPTGILGHHPAPYSAVIDDLMRYFKEQEPC
ncbi:MAG: hypothetical protein Q7P63_17240 [Verrucomicrobiota bacterium JB022]|nr:hypothetical protein [Verrucomicrobiota bacterium JB022]